MTTTKDFFRIYLRKGGRKMGEKELRRSLAVFPIGTVMKLTDLSARQIRYYEEQRLVIPERSETNRRLYSLNDVDRLLEIKDYLADGLTILAIQKIFNKNTNPVTKESVKETLTDEDVRRIFYDEIMHISRYSSGEKWNL